MKPKSNPSLRLNRRDFLKIAGLTGGASILAACGTKVVTTPETQVPIPTQPPAKIPLSFWTPGGSDVYCKGFGTIAANYMKDNPNIELGETKCNPTGENYTEVLLANIAAGTPPDATIVWTSPVTYAVRGAVIPLDDFMKTSKYSQTEAWPKGVLASCLYRGKAYGLPVTAGTYALFYNEEMFEKAGLSSKREDFPKTWDDLRRISKEFTKWDGDLLKVAGFIPMGGPSDFYGMAVEFPIWSHTNGGRVFDNENMKYTINSEQNLQLMHYALEWWDEEYHGDLIKVNTSANWAGYADAKGRPPAFQEGVYAVFNSGFWLCSDMYAAELKFERWNVAPYPVGPGGKETASGYWPNWLVIPKASPHPKEAFDYLDYMSAVGVRTWFDNIPDLPTNANVPNTLVPSLVVKNRNQEFAANVTDFFRHQLDVATPMWNSPVEDFYLDKLSLALEQILSKKATPEDALGEVQRACQEELDKVLKG